MMLQRTGGLEDGFSSGEAFASYLLSARSTNDLKKWKGDVLLLGRIEDLDDLLDPLVRAQLVRSDGDTDRIVEEGAR